MITTTMCVDQYINCVTKMMFCDNFCVCYRNAVLEGNLSELGYSAPKARKTGTTIAGMMYKVMETFMWSVDCNTTLLWFKRLLF